MADFVNLGGLAGTCALIWQLVNFSIEQYRRPRLKSLGPVSFQVPNYLDCGDTFFITLPIGNEGRKSALGCMARAEAIPVSGQGLRRGVWLHWAETPHLEQEVATPVDIPPGGTRRLDVAFSRRGRSGSWLATQRALIGKYSQDAELGEGEYTLEISVTCEDGKKVKSLLYLRSSPDWEHLDASEPQHGYLTRSRPPAGGRRKGLLGKIGFARP
jgi:hypothetical protein